MHRFRLAMDSDLDAIMGMMRRYYAEDDYPFVERDAIAAVVALMRYENLGRIWVATENESVLGYLAVTLGFSLEYRGRDAFIDELYIVEDHRNQGIGTSALELAESYCREVGVRAVHLEVERHRASAIALYSRIGFAENDRRLMTKHL